VHGDLFEVEKVIDERRRLIVPGDREKTIHYCVDHWFQVAQEAIADHGYFAVALSGGSTPLAIFQKLSAPHNRDRIDWSKLFLFWGDERSVPPHHVDNNYRMAMEEGGLNQLPLNPKHIFRMEAEHDIESQAIEYERILKKILKDRPLDLIMLGMGDDGHTASLFPNTEGLHVENRWVIANYVPQKNSWRMSFTFDFINQAHHIFFYVLGKEKKEMLEKILEPFSDLFPAQKIGTPLHPAYWIIDLDASRG